MNIRASKNLLRGVKSANFLLIGIFCVSIISVASSQSVQAENFLSKTVRCLVGTVLTFNCPQPAANAPSAPAPSYAKPQPNQMPTIQGEPQGGQAQAASGASSESAAGQADTNEASAVPAAGETAADPRSATVATYNAQLDPSVHRPIEIAYLSDAEPNPYSGIVFPGAQGQGIHFSTYGSPSGVQGVSNFAVVESSRDGWKIAGVAWYWWAIAAVAGLAFIMYRRYRRVRLAEAR